MVPFCLKNWYWSAPTNTYHRVLKFTEGNGIDGTVVFGEVLCGNQTNEICYCGGLFVNNQGFIYYSDISKHNVVKITPFSQTVVQVAGTSGVAGSSNNQLNFPGGIYVDSNNTLYVVDRANK